MEGNGPAAVEGWRCAECSWDPPERPLESTGCSGWGQTSRQQWGAWNRRACARGTSDHFLFFTSNREHRAVSSVFPSPASEGKDGMEPNLCPVCSFGLLQAERILYAEVRLDPVTVAQTEPSTVLDLVRTRRGPGLRLCLSHLRGVFSPSSEPSRCRASWDLLRLFFPDWPVLLCPFGSPFSRL